MRLIQAFLSPNKQKVIVQNLAACIEFFFISITTPPSEDLELTELDIMESWLTYISEKYKHVTNLDIRYGHHGLDYLESYNAIVYESEVEEGIPRIRHNPYRQSILDLVSNMSKLVSYSILFSPSINKCVVEAMYISNIRLEGIHLNVIPYTGKGPTEYENKAYIHERDDGRSIFSEYLLPSAQAKSLKELIVSNAISNHEGYAIFLKQISQTANHLCNLTSLKLNGCFTIENCLDSLTYILKQIPALEQLSVELFEGFTGIDHSYVNNMTVTSNLKSLTITQFTMKDNSRSTYNLVNVLFSKLWRICHQLESFTLSGSIKDVHDNGFGDYDNKDDGTFLNLSFTSSRLKSVTIDIAGFDYYQFNDIKEKFGYWSNYYHRARIIKDVTLPNVINLAWRGKPGSLNLRYLEPLDEFGSLSEDFIDDLVFDEDGPRINSRRGEDHLYQEYTRENVHREYRETVYSYPGDLDYDNFY